MCPLPRDNPRYSYWPLPDRPALQLPDEARVGVWVVPNVEHFHFDRPISLFPAPSAALKDPDVANYAVRDYGLRVGIWRLMEVLDKYGIRATVALNAEVCDSEPQIIRAGVERKWEWMGHGLSNSTWPTQGLAPDAEKEVILQVRDTIARATGAAPSGWLSPGLSETSLTLDLLAEAGFDYVADWRADDQPFPLRVRNGRMIALPATAEINDVSSFVLKGFTGEEYSQVLCDHFDVLYAGGERTASVMALSLHPYIVGQPHRVKWLDRALDYISGHRQVWFATGSDIAGWYYANYYELAPH